jgi:glutathione synthase
MKIIAIQGDKLESLKLNGDTSLYIASVMEGRGYKIFWYEQSSLTYLNGEISAIGHYISVRFHRENEGEKLQYEIVGAATKLNLATVSSILIRQNPPIDINYITSTHILSVLKNSYPHIFFINDPNVIINYGEKFLPMIVCPKNIPNTILSRDIDAINSFIKKYEKSIVKPIYSYGGNDIFLVQSNEINKIQSLLEKTNDLQLIVQEFLPQIYSGDKRVIVCNGKILGAMSRIAEEGNFLTNTGMGGKVSKCSLSDSEIVLCQDIADKLDKLGIFLAGIDLIGSYVTEINITSVGLITWLDILYGSESLNIFFNLIEEKIT